MGCFGRLGAQNIAHKKSYKWSVSPNYKGSVSSGDKVALTDGLYTNDAHSRFWSKKTTVGWSGKSRVSITIDLGQIEPLENLSFNTAAGTANVHFPQNVYVFVSDDAEHYKYVGDASYDQDRQYGTYEIRKFSLNNINYEARYVTLEIIPEGKYLFTDEIEVLKGKAADSEPIGNSFSQKARGAVIDSLKNQTHKLANLQRIADELSEKKIQLDNGNFSEFKKKNNPEKIRNSISQQYGAYLAKRFNTSYIVEKQNPWDDTYSKIYEPERYASKLNYSYTIPGGGVQYGAFSITNSSTSTQTISFEVSNSNLSIQQTTIYNVPFMPYKDGREVADPIIPLESEIQIDAGFTKLFFFKLKGLKEGSSSTVINVHGANKDEKITIHSKVLNVFRSKEEYALDANIWAYLNYAMINDRKKEATIDLENHHVNTAVLSLAVLPRFKASSHKYEKITDYLKNYRDIKNVLIFYNFKSSYRKEGYKGGQFMSATWKKYFIEWYNNVEKAISKSGFSDPKIYFFPYDELRESEVQEFKDFMKWAKKAIPNIKFYATLSRKETFAEILPLLDIAQLSTHDKQLFEQLPAHNTELWTYGNKIANRSASPYKYGRLKAWHAFANNVKGIGFWTYAERNKQFISASPINPAVSYSVIYNGPDKSIISTRRWEAFKLGIEDYQILYLYEKKFGRQKTMSMVNNVLDNPNDLNRADTVRNKMLNRL